MALRLFLAALSESGTKTGESRVVLLSKGPEITKEAWGGC